MGIAIGSITPWALMLAMVRRNKQDVTKALYTSKSANALLEERNGIGRLQVAALNGILHRLEGIFDRMPQPEDTADDLWSAEPEPKPEPSEAREFYLFPSEPSLGHYPVHQVRMDDLEQVLVREVPPSSPTLKEKEEA
jgi:hypothetical protein